MDKRKIFIIICLVCIVLLILANFRINSVSKQFNENCKVNYSSYLEEGECPCMRQKFDKVNLSSLEISNNSLLDFSYFNTNISN